MLSLAGVEHHQVVGAGFQLALGLPERRLFGLIHLFGLIFPQAAAEVGQVRFDPVFLVLIQLFLALGKGLVYLVGQ